MGGAAERRDSGRRAGATGPGAAVRGPQRHPGRPQAPVAGVEDGGWRMVRFAGSWEACARGRPGWWQGEGPRLDAYMYVCLWARGALSRVDFVDWGGRWCGSLSSTHSIYISTQCNVPRQKASLVVGGLRAPPQATLRGAWPRPGGAPGASTPPPAKGTCPCVLLTGAAALRGAASLGPRGPGDHHTEPLTGATGPRGGPRGLGGTGARAL